jgi:predicted ATPase/serine phosphatase RsbU (regulator of sigma subunit)
MSNLGAYTLGNVLIQRSESTVYIAEHTVTKKNAIVNVLLSGGVSAQTIAAFRTQYDIMKELSSLDANVASQAIPRALEFFNTHTEAALVLDSNHAEPLYQAAKKNWNLDDTLSFAVKTAAVLAMLHDANIMYKDVSPYSLFIQGRGQALNVLLLDFRLASRLSSEKQEISAVAALQADLHYISPEQTGRMNRTIDYRTDFYSLGVVLYELLTGTLPATGDDQMQIVHAHIAKQPPAPHDIDNKIPRVVSDIVMKLLSKNAENRYNTAHGLQADLQECVLQWTTQGAVSDFVAGKNDISSKFSIPQKLYGREGETKQLLDAFHHAAETGESKLLLVGGYSGVGKSALIYETHKPITEKRGYFISGKFDQFQRNIPFSAIVQAFRGLMKQLLSESNEQLNIWKEKITEALRENAQVIVEVIPELERVIGKQRPIIELAPSENQNRFYLTFDKFIRVFAQKEHPLVMFIDDLQWADGATLNLAKTLFANNEPSHLLVIGAYRDNEVNPAHPFILTVEEIKKSGYPVETIILQPLVKATIEEMLADTLKTSPKNVADLAQLIMDKTGGNPFFMTEFLKTLNDENLLNFDRAANRWTWNVNDINTKGITDNVVELMVNKMKKLPLQTQEILQLGACVGNQFSLQTLAAASGKSVPTVALDLWSAVQEGMIIPKGDAHQLLKGLDTHSSTEEVVSAMNAVDRFLHDRVQQAAYSMLSEEVRTKTHYTIGTILLTTSSAEEREEKIFDIVNQINQGLDYAVTQQERDEYAILNIEAAKKAKESAAYEPALVYAETAHNLLGTDAWKRRYDLTLDVANQTAELQMLLGHYETMDAIIDEIRANAKNFMDSIPAANTRIYSHKLRSEHEEAVRVGLAALRSLNVKFPAKGTQLTAGKAIVQAKIALRRGVPDLSTLKPLTDERVKAACNIMGAISGSAYNCDLNLSASFSPASIALHTKYGFMPLSAVSFMNYSAVLAAVLGDVKGAKELSDFALKMIEYYKDEGRKFYHLAKFTYSFLLSYWFEPIQNSKKLYYDIYQQALEYGDMEYAGYAIGDMPYTLYFHGAPIQEIIAESQIALHACQKVKQQSAVDYVSIFAQTAWNLTNERPDPECLDGEHYSESEIEVSRRIGRKSNIAEAFFAKTTLAFFWGNYRNITDVYAPEFQKYLDYMTGSFFIPSQRFYEGMAFFALAHQDSASKQKYISEGTKRLKFHKKMASLMPFNAQHFYELLQAEYFAATGNHSEAARMYEQAISTAKMNKFQNVVCIAYEAAARFYLRAKNTTVAEVYLQKALENYYTWGATAKVAQMQHEFAEYNLKTPQATIVQTNSNKTSVNESSGSLDMLSVIKSSQTLAGEIELRSLLEKMLIILKENAGAQKCVIALNEQHGEQGNLFIQAESADAEAPIILQHIPLEKSTSASLSIINTAARLLTPIVLGDASTSSEYANDSYIKGNNVQSVLCNPIVNQGKLVGVLYLENNLATEAFTPDRIQVLNVLSSQVAVSIENAMLVQSMTQMERLKKEMEMAASIQLGMLPKELPKIEGYDLAALCEMAKEAGGDLYDVLEVSDGKYLIVIGDVSGKGMPAALYMSAALNVLRTEIACFALEAGRTISPATMLKIVNKMMKSAMKRGSFITLFVAILDTKAHTFTYTSGGHDPCVVWNPTTKRKELINTKGKACGPIAPKLYDPTVVEQEINIQAGDYLFFNTDGITEAKDSAAKEYTDTRYHNDIEDITDSETPQIALETLFKRVKLFAGEAPQYDDMTMLCIRRLPL